MPGVVAHHERLRSKVAATCAGVAVAVGLLVLVGWAGDIAVLKSVVPGLATMKVNTALSFVLSGLSLFAVGSHGPSRPRLRAVGLATALLVLATALLTLAQYAFSIDLGIDQFFVRDPAGSVATSFPGRMALITTLVFLLIGLTLLLVHVCYRPLLTQTFAALAFLVSALCCVSYLYGTHSLQSVAPFSSVAAHTAAVFLLVSLGLLAASPQKGLVGLLVSDGVGGMLVRRLLPAIVVVPVLLGWLGVAGQQVGWYGTEFGTAVFAVSNIMVFATLVVWTASRLQQIEEKLKESERTYRAIGESIDYGVWVCAPDGRNTYASPSFLKLVGITQEQCSEFGWGNILHPDEMVGTILAWKECARARGKWDREHRFRGVDGQYHPVLARGVPVEDDQGNLLGWAGINLDISSQKRAENGLRELNATLEQRVAVATATIEAERRLLDAVLEALPVAVIISEPNGRLVRFNRACDEVWGLNPLRSGSTDEYGEWVGYWPGSGERVKAHEWALSRALLQGESCPGELMEIERFGLRDRRFVINSAAPVRGADGRIIAGVVATLDVTDRIKAEAALRATEAESRMWAEAVPQIVWITRPDGWNTYFNQQWMDYTGLTREESLGHGWNKPFHPEDQQRAWLAWQNATTTISTYALECRLRRADGIYRWWLIRGVPLKDAAGNILKWFGTCTDIDDLKRAEAELRESEERFHSAFDSAPIGMALNALDGRWLQVNRSLCEIVGYTKQELLATNFQTLTHPDDLDTDLDSVRQVIAGAIPRYQMEKRYLHKRGHVVHILLSASLVRGGDGQPLYFVAQIMDITQQKEDEKALAANEALLRQFIRHSPAAIAMFDRDRRYIQTSDRWLIDYHLTGRDIVGLSHYEVFPDNSEQWQAIHQRVLAGAVERCEEDPFEQADGSTEWLQWECRPWRNAEGEVGGLIMFTQVITERKVVEEQVRASLREKEVLLKEIHHRVKNNLQVVSTLLDLQSDHTADPAAREMFKESRGRVKSMALIHERLYRSQDMARVNFGEYVRQLAADLHRTYRVSEGIRLELDVDIPPLAIDIAIPCGLLLNELISNCFKHAFADAAEGCLRVALHRVGEANVLTVADDGVGFPAGADFRNTTSFGLQLVNTMVDQLDGEIALTTDRGTTFTIHFPKPSSSPAGTLP